MGKRLSCLQAVRSIQTDPYPHACVQHGMDLDHIVITLLTTQYHSLHQLHLVLQKIQQLLELLLQVLWVVIPVTL